MAFDFMLLQYFNYTFNVKVSYAIFKFGNTKIEIPAYAGMNTTL